MSLQDVRAAVLRGVDNKKIQCAVLSQLRDFVEANVNPDNSENFFDPATDDMGALVVALEHPEVATDPNLCLLCLTVCPRPCNMGKTAKLGPDDNFWGVYLVGAQDSVQEEVQSTGNHA